MYMIAMPDKSLGDCRSLLMALDREYAGYAGILNSIVYYDAFQICIAYGDQARASVFAGRSYETRVLCEGDDSLEAKKMKALAPRPAMHGAFGMSSMKWKTSKALVPKKLDHAQLQVWLFQ
jgi:hypothetical protein